MATAMAMATLTVHSEIVMATKTSTMGENMEIEMAMTTPVVLQEMATVTGTLGKMVS